MKGYVAGRWTERARAAKVIAALRAAGHSITHDWTISEEPPGLTGEALDDFYDVCARKDLQGVLDGEFFVLLHHPGCRGAFVEFGAALGARIPSVVVGGGDCPVTTSPIFYWLPEVQHIDQDEEVVGAVNDLEAARLAA